MHSAFTTPNHNIYWLIALLASDLSIKTLRGFVEREARRCNRECICTYTRTTLTPPRKLQYSLVQPG